MNNIERYKINVDNRFAEHESQIDFLALNVKNNNQKTEYFHDRIAQQDATITILINKIEDIFREIKEIKEEQREMQRYISECYNDYYHMKQINDATVIVKSQDVIKDIFKVAKKINNNNAISYNQH
jgi:uncharacterized protein YoxC